MRILIVEDDSDTAVSLQKLLKLNGHDSTIAATFTDAVRLIGDMRFDAILCDLGLPDRSGLNLPPHVPPHTPRTRLIAFTGYGQPQEVREALACGFHAHLLKPTDIADVLAELARPIDGMQPQMETASPRLDPAADA